MVSKLTQKERTILQDQLRHEEVCINKYRDYAARTSDSTLRGLFNEFAQDEQQHHSTLNGMLGGASGQTRQTGTGSVGAGGQGTQGTAGSAGQGKGASSGLAGNVNDEAFIRAAADERLQSKGFAQTGQSGQSGQPSQAGKTQQWGTSQQGQQMNQQLQQNQQHEQGQQLQSSHQQLQNQPSQQGQHSQQNQQSQSSNWPATVQEASRELIPMFRSETAQEFAGGAGIGGSDASTVRDMLMTEQFVSGSYDSAIFDSVSPEVRQTLQHIQKDEQKHGQGLRDYMQRKGLGQQ